MEDDDGVVLGCARVLDDGDEWRIGRVALHRTVRGQGWADRLMQTALQVCPDRDVVLDAQAPLAAWYATFGFEVVRPGVPRGRHPAPADGAARAVKVRVGAGTGVEWLMAAMAVADPDWRAVLTHGETAYDAALAAGGRSLVRDAGRIGRHGWIRLLGPLTRVRGAWSVEALRHEAASLSADGLRETLLGDGTQTSRWLVRASAADVRDTCLGVLDALPGPADRSPVLTPVRARLAEAGPEQLLDEVAPGLHYGPGVLRPRRARHLAPGRAHRGRARPA